MIKLLKLHSKWCVTVYRLPCCTLITSGTKVLPHTPCKKQQQQCHKSVTQARVVCVCPNPKALSSVLPAGPSRAHRCRPLTPGTSGHRQATGRAGGTRRQWGWRYRGCSSGARPTALPTCTGYPPHSAPPGPSAEGCSLADRERTQRSGDIHRNNTKHTKGKLSQDMSGRRKRLTGFVWFHSF